MVAILLASGVLLGALAIVVDVGRLYIERNDLQNGADSAAMALAAACAADEPACGSLDDLRARAQEYADANAADGASHVAMVCGVLPFGAEPCGDEPANLTGCLGDLPPAGYVEVRLSTGNADGKTVLPPAFAQTVAGGAGTTVGACARATWDEISILAVTINECVYNAAPHRPEGAPLQAMHEYAIQFWYWPGPPCGDASGPGPTPDIAGLLDDPDADCEIFMSANGNVDGSFFDFIPERVGSPACVRRVERAWDQHEVVYLPVFDARSSGDAPSFHHVMVAPFVVTAFQLGAPPSACHPRCTDPETQIEYLPEEYRKGSNLTSSAYHDDPCGTDEVGYRCLTGIFVGDPINVSQLTGRSRIRLVG